VIHLLVNAVVHTMDDSLPVAQALAVKDGRIVEVGGSDEILWLREDEYELIDLGGRTVVPGFVDPHNHFSIGALETFCPTAAPPTASKTSSNCWLAPRPRRPPESGCAASATTTRGCRDAGIRRGQTSTPRCRIVRRC